MSTPQEKFFSALNIAFHPSTKEGDILAGIRGAARLLQGKTVKQFLGTDNQTELAEKLATAEAKLKGADKHSAELQRNLIASEGKLEDAAEFIKAQSIEICRLKTEAAKAVETAVREAAREAVREAAKAEPPPQPPVAETVATAETHWTKGVVFGKVGLFVLVAGFVSILAILTSIFPPAAKRQPAPSLSEFTATNRPVWTDAKGRPCREYVRRGKLGGEETVAGCRDADGIWRIQP
jgi:hypothetical protein